MNIPGKRRPRSGRADPRGRGRLPAAELRARRAGRPAHRDGRLVPAPPGLLLLEPGSRRGTGLQDLGHRDDEPRPRRLAEPSGCSRRAAGDSGRRLAERALLPPAQRSRRAGRVRAVRRQASGSVLARRRRPLDEHLAGLQLLGRQRRRLGRQLVRQRRDPEHRSHAAVPRLRRAVSVSRLGSRLHRLAEPDREAGRLPHGRRRRRVPDRRRARRGVRPRRLPGSRGVRDGARVRRRPAVPRPRRQPHVPLCEQLLLEGAAGRAADDEGRALAAGRAAGGRARRRPVRGGRLRRAAGRVRRPRLHLGVHRDGARRRGSLRPVRVRDRRAISGVASRHAGARLDLRT